MNANSYIHTFNVRFYRFRPMQFARGMLRQRIASAKEQRLATLGGPTPITRPTPDTGRRWRFGDRFDPAPAFTSATITHRPRGGRRRMLRPVRLALGVIAAHVVVDSFIDLRPGVGPSDHVVSGTVPLVALGLLAAEAPRLRHGTVAACAGLLGVAVTFGMIGAPVAAAARGDVGPAQVTGVAAAMAGITLIAWATHTAYSTRRRGGPRYRRFLRRTTTTLVIAAAGLLVAVPIGSAYVVANRFGPVHPTGDFGAPHQEVTLHTADGLSLQAAYVPSRNGAAIILYPGVGGQGLTARARVLVRHGYGVLALEPRGQSASDGDPQLLGWTGEPDLTAAIDYLEARPDVRPDRIGGLGLSVGGELLIQTAAHDSRLAAVVSEGAGTRWFAEDLHTAFPAWLIQVPFMTTATVATSILCDCLPPERLDHLVTDVSPLHLMLIWSPRGQGGEWNNPRYHDLAGRDTELWEIPESTHTGGYTARPAEYENRVVGFYDRHL